MELFAFARMRGSSTAIYTDRNIDRELEGAIGTNIALCKGPQGVVADKESVRKARSLCTASQANETGAFGQALDRHHST